MLNEIPRCARDDKCWGGYKVSGENFTGKILTVNLLDQNQIVIPNEVRDLSGFIMNTLHNVVISSSAAGKRVPLSRDELTKGNLQLHKNIIKQKR